MKKLLLLSVFCFFAQVRTKESNSPEMTDEQIEEIKIFYELSKSTLKGATTREIRDCLFSTDSMGFLPHRTKFFSGEAKGVFQYWNDCVDGIKILDIYKKRNGMISEEEQEIHRVFSDFISKVEKAAVKLQQFHNLYDRFKKSYAANCRE